MNESETTTVHDLALTPPRNTVFRLEPSLETCFLYSVQFAPKKHGKLTSGGDQSNANYGLYNQQAKSEEQNVNHTPGPIQRTSHLDLFLILKYECRVKFESPQPLTNRNYGVSHTLKVCQMSKVSK